MLSSPSLPGIPPFGLRIIPATLELSLLAAGFAAGRSDHRAAPPGPVLRVSDIDQIPGQGVNTMMKIFVGNLSYSTTEDDLKATFSAYGAVDRVSVVTDRDTGQPRGFAFVEMPNRSEAETAISVLNGRELNGRALNVNEARPKPQGGSGGGGSRGGGGGRGGSRW